MNFSTDWSFAFEQINRYWAWYIYNLIVITYSMAIWWERSQNKCTFYVPYFIRLRKICLYNSRAISRQPYLVLFDGHSASTVVWLSVNIKNMYTCADEWFIVAIFLFSSRKPIKYFFFSISFHSKEWWVILLNAKPAADEEDKTTKKQKKNRFHCLHARTRNCLQFQRMIKLPIEMMFWMISSICAVASRFLWDTR